MQRDKKGPAPYAYQEFPAVFYGPDGQKDTFHSEDEVPEDWVDHPAKVGKEVTRTEFVAGNIAEDDDDVEALMEKYTQDALVKLLEDAQEDDDDIEFLKSWPKLKLAQTIVHHEVVPEDLHDEEDD